MTDCLFCKIADKEISSEIIYEDGETIAFLDVKPLAPGHTMVLPKEHASDILDLKPALIEPVFRTVKNVVGLIAKNLKPDGFTIGINHGQVSGQSVDHLHIHVIPRWQGDGGGSIHGVVNNPPKESLEEIKQKILKHGNS